MGLQAPSVRVYIETTWFHLAHKDTTNLSLLQVRLFKMFPLTLLVALLSYTFYTCDKLMLSMFISLRNINLRTMHVFHFFLSTLVFGGCIKVLLYQGYNIA